MRVSGGCRTATRRLPAFKRRHLQVGYYNHKSLDHLLSMKTPRFDQLAMSDHITGDSPACCVRTPNTSMITNLAAGARGI